MKIKSLMKRELVTLSPLLEVAAAARLLTERGITGAPVVDAKGDLLGVVSQTDLTRFSGQQPPMNGWITPDVDGDSNWQTTPVIAVMTEKAVTCDEEASVNEVASLMRKRHIHRVLVTRKGKLTGIVTSMDLLKVAQSV
jgi:CBS domain-containing protein